MITLCDMPGLMGNIILKQGSAQTWHRGTNQTKNSPRNHLGTHDASRFSQKNEIKWNTPPSRFLWIRCKQIGFLSFPFRQASMQNTLDGTVFSLKEFRAPGKWQRRKKNNNPVMKSNQGQKRFINYHWFWISSNLNTSNIKRPYEIQACLFYRERLLNYGSLLCVSLRMKNKTVKSLCYFLIPRF